MIVIATNVKNYEHILLALIIVCGLPYEEMIFRKKCKFEGASAKFASLVCCFRGNCICFYFYLIDEYRLFNQKKQTIYNISYLLIFMEIVKFYRKMRDLYFEWVLQNWCLKIWTEKPIRLLWRNVKNPFWKQKNPELESYPKYF